MQSKPCGLLAAFLCAGAAFAMDKAEGVGPVAGQAQTMGDEAADDSGSTGDGAFDHRDDFAEVGLREWSGEFVYLNTFKEDLWLTLVPCEENKAGAVYARFTDRLVLLSLDRNPSCFLRPGEAVALAAEIAPGRTSACRFLHAELGKVQWTLMINSRDNRRDLQLLLSPRPSRSKAGKMPFLKLQFQATTPAAATAATPAPPPPANAAAAAAGGPGPRKPPPSTPAEGAATAEAVSGAAPLPPDCKALT